MEVIETEYEIILDEICKKYGYETQDKPGNESLKTVLKRIIPSMLADYPQEDRNLFYQMLTHTPIVVTENLTEDELKKLRDTYIGNINPHIIDDDSNILGEYGKGVAPAAYITSPILNEDMQLMGKKSFLYLQPLSRSSKEFTFLGTDINVPYLIHELGHAFHAEKNAYKMLEDGILLERIGTAQFKYSFEKISDGKRKQKTTSCTGLFLEESLNTIQEEIAMARYMKMSKEEMQKKYCEVLVPSEYQGLMSNMTEYLLEKIDTNSLKQYRLSGDETKLQPLNDIMAQTDYWQNKDQTFSETNLNSPLSFAHKKNIVTKLPKLSMQDFFQTYQDIYFPDISSITTPIQKIDNVLEQCYNFKGIKYQFNLYNPEEKQQYCDIVSQILQEGFTLINQSHHILINQSDDIKKYIQQIAHTATAGQIVSITDETKSGFETLTYQKQGDMIKNEK